MPTRREARERALALAYERGQRAGSVADLLAAMPVPPDAYAARVVAGVEERQEEIDAIIGKFSAHWALERMPAVDRALLRIGVFELGWVAEVPAAVVISEAVELAKQYSTKDSGRFVNGLLGRIAEHLRGET